MRLIDADKLLEETRRDRDYARKNGFMDMYYERQTLIDRIEAQPTAYNVDKVVEEFDKKYNNSLWIKGNEEFSITRNELIEIVKHGGVTDDVCEWKLDGVYLHSPHKQLVSCVTDENYRYYYCPVCGKKIKVVE